MKTKILFYSGLGLLVIIADRLSKSWALNLGGYQEINEYLSFGLTFNRGINWGFFNSQNYNVFFGINILIAFVIAALVIYTIGCWLHRHPIAGNILIIAGALSNYYDRMIHGGVIDFIVLSWGTWSWPAFNIADAAICVGVGLMVLASIRDWKS